MVLRTGTARVCTNDVVLAGGVWRCPAGQRTKTERASRVFLIRRDRRRCLLALRKEPHLPD